MSKQNPPPEPPTILTVTLNTDGSATLLAQRGDLAVLHAFTYRLLDDIVSAMQHGASRLIDLTSHPPANEFQAAEPSMPDALQPEEASALEPNMEDPVPPSLPMTTAPTPSASEATPSESDQLSLF